MPKHLPCFPLDLQHSLVHEMVKMDNMLLCISLIQMWNRKRSSSSVLLHFTSRTQLLSSLSCFFFGLPLYVCMLYIYISENHAKIHYVMSSNSRCSRRTTSYPRLSHFFFIYRFLLCHYEFQSVALY